MDKDTWLSFATDQYKRVGVEHAKAHERAKQLVKNDERVLRQDPEEVAYDDWLNTFKH